MRLRTVCKSSESSSACDSKLLSCARRHGKRNAPPVHARGRRLSRATLLRHAAVKLLDFLASLSANCTLKFLITATLEPEVLNQTKSPKQDSHD
jgi:hypothetical protein